MANHKVTAASKDYNARGKCRHHWFRMLWAGGSWQYFADERLPSGTYLAADRGATVYGDVETGDVLVQHDRGGKVDIVYVVVDLPDGQNRKYACMRLPFRRRAGKLLVSMPFEDAERVYPDPRA